MSETPNENPQQDRRADHDENAHRAHSEKHSSGKPLPRRKLQIPSEEQCLAGLGGIPGMCLTGRMSTGLANVFRGVYGTLLQHYRQPKSAKAAPVVEQQSLMDAVRKQPSLLNTLAVYLSEEQIDELLKEIQGDESEAA